MKKLHYLLIVFALFLVCGINVKAASKTISNGTYTISSAIHNGYVLDVTGGTMKNRTNIQLYKGLNSKSQQWKVTYLGSGYYSIVSAKNTSYALDFAGTKKKNGTNIQLWKYKKTNKSQHWIIKDAGGGYYYIIARNTGLYASVKGRQAVNKSNIHAWTGYSGKAQKFVFSPVVKGTKTISDGTYVISSKLSNSKVVEFEGNKPKNCANVQLNQFTNGINQHWYVSYLGNGYYSIKNLYIDDYSLDVAGIGKTKKTNVQLYKSNGYDGQQFVIQSAGNGYYKIIAKNSGLAIDIAGAKSANGTNIQTWTNFNTNGQLFKFTKATYINAPEVAIDYDDDNGDEPTRYVISYNYFGEEEDYDGVEIYGSSDGNNFSKINNNGEKRIYADVNDNAMFFKVRLYKNTYNGKAYSDFSNVEGINLLEAKLLTHKIDENDENVTYNIVIDIPSIAYFHDFVEDKDPLLEIEKLSTDTGTWEHYATENGYQKTMTIPKNMSWIDAFDSYYRMRIVYEENGVQKYSDYVEFNLYSILITEPSFDMEIIETSKDDGTTDYTFSAPKDFENVNYMKLYELDENNDIINEDEPVYEGSNTSYTLNISDTTNKRYQMYLYNREDGEDGYSMELLKVSRIHEIDYRVENMDSLSNSVGEQ